ncbi:MAG: hypothetical protein P1U68_00515 [Verrucomicrobiales bacterium]|nr:hypothetical protein [Verrucomicrobiales bacterium]
MSKNVEKFESSKSKGAVIFVAGFTGFLGLISLLAFARAMPHIQADEIFVLVFASALIAFTILFLKYSFATPWMLSSRELTIRHFFGARSIPYHEICSLGNFSKTFRPNKPRGGKMNTILTTHHLVIETRDGRRKTYTLPSFGDNSALLNSLAKRSGITLRKLPDKREDGLSSPS